MAGSPVVPSRRVKYKTRISFLRPAGAQVYLAALRKLQKLYGVRTVLLATDNADGAVRAAHRAEVLRTSTCAPLRLFKS